MKKILALVLFTVLSVGGMAEAFAKGSSGGGRSSSSFSASRSSNSSSRFSSSSSSPSRFEQNRSS